MNDPDAMPSTADTVDVIDLCLTTFEPVTATPYQLSVIRASLDTHKVHVVLHNALRAPIEPLPEANFFFRPDHDLQKGFLPSVTDIHPYILKSVNLHGNVCFPHADLTRQPALRCLSFPSRDFLCATRIARHLWPAANTHADLPTLCYWLDIEPWPNGFPASRPLRRASAAAAIIRKARSLGNSMRTLVSLSRQPVLLRTLPTGPYAGIPCKDVPREWLHDVDTDQMHDSDIVHTIDHFRTAA